MPTDKRKDPRSGGNVTPSTEAVLHLDFDDEVDDKAALRILEREDPDDPDFLEIEIQPPGVRAASCRWIDLLTLSNVPDTKIVWVQKCWKIFWRKVCIKLPKVYYRKCKIVIQLQVCHPDLEDIWKDVNECFRHALTPYVVSLFMAGKIGKAYRSFIRSLLRCLREKGIERLAEFNFGIRRVRTCDAWRPL